MLVATDKLPGLSHARVGFYGDLFRLRVVAV